MQEPKQKIKAEAPRVIPPATPKPTPKKPDAPKPTEPKVVEPKKITYIFFTDNKNHKIVNAKYGDTIRAHIGSTGLIDHKVKIKAYDHEVMGENHFLGEVGNYTISANLCHVDIVLTKEMKEHGANLFSDEVYVDIEIMETKAHVVSTQIKVDTNNSIFEIARNITKAKVGVNREASKKEGTCVCKSFELYWGKKVSCEFRKKVIEISKRQNVDPNNLMSAIAHETGGTFDTKCGTFKKHKDESKEGYVGLIQIGKDAAKSIGTTRTKLLKMSQLEQLVYVEKYISLPQVKGKLNTLTDFYLAILFPVDCGKGNEPNHIVFDNSLTITYKTDGNPIKNLNYWRNVAYKANPAFHKEGKKESGKTYVWEIAENIQIWKDKGEKNKVSVFECQKNIPKTNPEIESGIWNVIITESYTGKKCTHEENTPFRENCRRGKIEVYDHTKKLVLTISDCLLEGIAGEDRTKTDSDAPFGTFQISSSPFIDGSSSGDKRTSYGPNPRLSFEPIKGSGDEADKSGRSLIRIHGGRQETKKFAPRPSPTLMRTHGCIRVFDSDAKAFYDWWVEFNNSNPDIKPGKLKIIK
jgi:L,D-transpeptidase catalytic domain